MFARVRGRVARGRKRDEWGGEEGAAIGYPPGKDEIWQRSGIGPERKIR